MKIQSDKDVEALDLKIQNELGIDVKKYRNEEVVADFMDLLVFPKYVVNWSIRPILIALALFVAGFFFIDLTGFEYIYYVLFGLILFLLSGLFGGILFLIWKMKSDMMGIFDYVMDVLKMSVTDLDHVSDRINPNNRKDVLGLLFQGITHVVAIPTISEGLNSKVPFVGGILMSVIKKVMTKMSDNFEFDEEEFNKEEIKNEKDENKILEAYSNAINASSSGVNKVLNVAFRIARTPIMFIFLISFSLLLLLLYTVW